MKTPPLCPCFRPFLTSLASSKVEISPACLNRCLLNVCPGQALSSLQGLCPEHDRPLLVLAGGGGEIKSSVPQVTA